MAFTDQSNEFVLVSYKVKIRLSCFIGHEDRLEISIPYILILRHQKAIDWLALADFTAKKVPVPILKELEWVPGSIWTEGCEGGSPSYYCSNIV